MKVRKCVNKKRKKCSNRSNCFINLHIYNLIEMCVLQRISRKFKNIKKYILWLWHWTSRNTCDSIKKETLLLTVENANQWNSIWGLLGHILNPCPKITSSAILYPDLMLVSRHDKHPCSLIIVTEICRNSVSEWHTMRRYWKSDILSMLKPLRRWYISGLA